MITPKASTIARPKPRNSRPESVQQYWAHPNQPSVSSAGRDRRVRIANGVQGRSPCTSNYSRGNRQAEARHDESERPLPRTKALLRPRELEDGPADHDQPGSSAIARSNLVAPRPNRYKTSGHPNSPAGPGAGRDRRVRVAKRGAGASSPCTSKYSRETEKSITTV
jgi:hypothetical protein